MSEPMQEKCFHCGLPVPEHEKARFTVLGEQRRFCCSGCEAVCRSIVQSGLEDYYRHREDAGAGVAAEALPDIMAQLTLYDRPEIQSRFVRSTGGETREAHLMLENIRCAACIWLNEQHLRAQPGVIDVQLDYTTHQARLRWDPKQTQLSNVLKSITDLGYVAHPFDPSHRERLLEDEQRRSLERLLFSGFLGMQIMMFAIATYWMGGYQADGKLPLWEIIGRWTSLAVTLALIIYGGADFFVGAWRDLKQKRLGMDLPIVLGLITAFLGSVWGTWQNHEYVYYDSIGMFVFFVLLARHLEMRGRRAAASALDRLMRIIPTTAQRLTGNRPDSERETVAVADLRPGDQIFLAAGDVLPVDARLDDIEAAVDESHLTGESRPVVYRQGQLISAGTAAQYQPLRLTVEHLERDSATTLLQESLMTGIAKKPKLASLADRISSPFVAIVLITAALTALIWLWLNPAQILPNTIAVLIITCPCALALATPVALTLAAGRMTEIGVLPMNMAAIDTLATADLFVFDKTGTLTHGQPKVNRMRRLPQAAFDNEQLLTMTALLEHDSAHPIGNALQEYAEERGINPTPLETSKIDRVVHESSGVSGWMGEQKWQLMSAPDELREASENAHSIQVALFCNQIPQAVFHLSDTLRPGTDTLLNDLRATGATEFTLLSGDHADAVVPLAQKVGFSEVQANMKPEDKLEWINHRQQPVAQSNTRPLVMIGDGLNDTLALAAAGAAISFGKAIELAQRHSDFLVLGQSLSVIAPLREIAQDARHIIRQNLTWALAYNILAIPAAAAGLITPWMAAIGMSVSSLAVVLNALRLKRRSSASQVKNQVSTKPTHHKTKEA